MKSPNVPVSRSDQTEKQSGSEALPDGRLAHSSVLFENKKKQLHPQDCRIDPPAVLFCKKTKPHRPGAPRSPPRQRAFRSVRELQSSQQAAPLQFRRSACLYPAKRSAGSGPFGNLRAQPLSFTWTVRILSLTAPPFFVVQFFPAGTGSGSRRRSSRNNPHFYPPIPFFRACFPPPAHILAMTPGCIQMFTIPAADFRHLNPAGKRFSSLCETSKKFVYQVLTKRRQRSIIVVW